MKDLKSSDLFMKAINKNNEIFGRINTILYGTIPGSKSDIAVINNEIFPDIKRKIIDKRRDEISANIGMAISQHKLVLLMLPPEKRLMDAVPFIIYKQDGIRRVAINMSNVVIARKLENGQIIYDMSDNVNKIYVLLHSAYLALTKLDVKQTLSPSALYSSAVLWAEMFNKPIYDAVGLHNHDRKEAFMYFAMKFFLLYMMECPKAQADSIVMKYVEKKNDLIIHMEDIIETRNLPIYSGLLPFLETLFNNEVSAIKGLQVNTISKSMNTSFYLRNFTQSFGSSALLALCSYPYFVFVIIAAISKCRLVKDKSFDRIFSNNQKMANALLVDLMRG